MGEFELKLRFHKPTHTYILTSGYLDRNVRVNGNLITGPGVRFWNDLVVRGGLILGKGSRVGGQVFAKKAILCAYCRVVGGVQVDEQLQVHDGCVLTREVLCRGDVRIRPRVVIDSLKSNGTVVVEGKTDISNIKAKKLIEVPEGVFDV